MARVWAAADIQELFMGVGLARIPTRRVDHL